MEIKLIALDLDGTALLEDHRTLSPATRAAIGEALEAGIQVLPCTGRCRQLLPPDFLAIPGVRYAVTSNGAAVWDLLRDRCLFSDGFSPDAIARLIAPVRSAGQLAEFFLEGNLFVEHQSMERLDQCYVPGHHQPLFDRGEVTVVEDFPAYVAQRGLVTEKINLTHVAQPDRGRISRELLDSGLAAITASLSSNLEVNTPTANKGRGLEALCRCLGLEMDQVMALGDNENDLDMMAMCGLGVAMGNSTPACMAAAKAVTTSNLEDGVALAIRRFALGEAIPAPTR